MNRILLAALLLSAAPACLRAEPRSSGGIVKFGEDVHIAAGENVAGPVVAVGGSIRAEGAVGGPLVAIGGHVELGSEAVVRGPAVSLGGKTLRAEGGRVEGPIVDLPGGRALRKAAAVAAYLGAASAAIYVIAKASAGVGWIVLSVVLVALFPKPLRQTKDHLDRRFVECALAGLIAWPAGLVISVTLLASVIGAPLIPLLLTVAAAAYVWGFSSIAYLLGERLAMGRWKNPFASMVVGMLVLKLLQWVPVVQWAVFSIVAIVGVGASILSRFGLKTS